VDDLHETLCLSFPANSLGPSLRFPKGFAVKKRTTVIATVFALAVAALLTKSSRTHADKAKEDPAIERTRKQVRMLDDIYKTAVVLITKHYVTEESDLAAGEAAKALFAAIKEKGWHEVRLLDATGEPLEDVNLPKDVFEKAAIEKLKSGENWYEKIVSKDDGKYLRAATPIPVVLKKCVLCHDNYKDVKEGRPIGALSYTVPIE
jgi:hypothetical protein